MPLPRKIVKIKIYDALPRDILMCLDGYMDEQVAKIFRKDPWIFVHFRVGTEVVAIEEMVEDLRQAGKRVEYAS